MAGREKFTVDNQCPHCGQPGRMAWEENGGADLARGPERKFIAASEGFHPQTGRPGSGDPLIVCERCGTFQPD
jgi:hypothetical protein